MSEAMKMSSLSKNTSFRAATVEDIDVMISIIGDYYGLNLRRLRLLKAVHHGFGCQTNECRSLLCCDRNVGFFVARHIPLNTPS